MGKRFILVLAIALALSFSVAAYAEVQNLKVSGDISMSGVDRRNFSLSETIVAGVGRKYDASGLLTATRVRLDADLTDNVATTVRLLNERSWGQESTVDTEDTNIDVDLAYVTLKEFLYSPLTMTVGRQELRFGNALIIGDVDTNRLSQGSTGPGDLSSRKAFDAIRATLNYDPLVVDLIFSKIDENGDWWNTAPERRDTDLYGVNLKYDLSGMGITGTGEAYYFNRVNRNVVQTITGVTKADMCETVGASLAGKIRGNLSGSVEFAYQFGKSAQDVTGTNTLLMLDRHAWAVQSALNLALSKKWSPNLGLIFTYLTGDDKANGSDTFWDPMFEDQSLNNIVNAILPNTNVIAINAKASIRPAEDVTLTGVYGYYMLAKAMDNAANGIPSTYGTAGFFGGMTENHSLGHAFDLTGTYDYTEDVQLGLTFGYFDPGSAFANTREHTATQVIGSMKVTF